MKKHNQNEHSKQSDNWIYTDQSFKLIKQKEMEKEMALRRL